MESRHGRRIRLGAQRNAVAAQKRPVEVPHAEVIQILLVTDSVAGRQRLQQACRVAKDSGRLHVGVGTVGDVLQAMARGKRDEFMKQERLPDGCKVVMQERRIAQRSEARSLFFGQAVRSVLALSAVSHQLHDAARLLDLVLRIVELRGVEQHHVAEHLPDAATRIAVVTDAGNALRRKVPVA